MKIIFYRYIVTSPDRNILSRQELDAFLATAFSPHMLNVDYTQELVVSNRNCVPNSLNIFIGLFFI